MKQTLALAGALAVFLLSPQIAGTRTYHGARHLQADDALKVRIVTARHLIVHYRTRTWAYQDARGARRSVTAHLERHVHALPRLRRLTGFWWRLAVRNRRMTHTWKRAQAASRPVIDSCTRALIEREGSGWDPTATNPTTGAYGLPQALPGSKMAAAGADWATNPATQVRWMTEIYIPDRYGSSCAALAHSYSYGWY